MNLDLFAVGAAAGSDLAEAVRAECQFVEPLIQYESDGTLVGGATSARAFFRVAQVTRSDAKLLRMFDEATRRVFANLRSLSAHVAEHRALAEQA